PADDSNVQKLSGGERRRVALCRLLLEAPDLLLLDEPTNHLDAESVSWLEGHLRNYPGAILIVTHDRYFLDNVTGWILELDRGRGWRRKGARRRRGSAPLPASRNGLPLRRARARRSRRRAINATRNWSSRLPQTPRRPRRSSYRSPSGSAKTSSISRICGKAMA